MLFIDIGIDLGGAMCPIIFKGQTLPYDYELKLSPMYQQNEIEIGFYEGQRSLVKNNQIMGKVFLINIYGSFAMSIKIDINRVMTVFIEDNLLATYNCLNESTSFFMIKEAENFIEEDIKIKEKETNRQMYKEYISQTLYTLRKLNEENKNDKNYENMINIILRAEDIGYVEDITTEEFILAQEEIETIVNNYMNNIVKIVNLNI
uniref:Uncharacterized protein n=1 Tax=viral metagenome TaxID=1070528 RepID=A0A6C0EU62_9ZZZZ